jgi:dehydrogenase/reductase SDR family member 12
MIFDRALDLAVVPGFSRLGFTARGLGGDPIAGSLAGRTALVTGGNSGLGEAICERFVARGAHVHMLVRDEDRGRSAASRIGARHPGAEAGIELEICDVSDLTSVRNFAEAFQARCDRLDLLVHNAGILPEERSYTADGVELTFATNVLGPFLLTSLLLPSLLAGAPSRVITVSSGGMYTARLSADDPQLEREAFGGARFYAHTKRAQVVLNRLWSERSLGGRISFSAMHPGWVDTPGLRASLPRFHRFMGPLLRDADQGSDTVVWLATASTLEPVTGGFWHDRAPRSEHRFPWTRETANERDRLWRECERLTTLTTAPHTAAAH